MQSLDKWTMSKGMRLFNLICCGTAPPSFDNGNGGKTL